MLHLGWFVGAGYSVHAWNQPWSGRVGEDWAQPDLYIDLAKAMERACFDYVLIEDGQFVADSYGGSTDYFLRNAFTVPKADPMPLVPLVAQATKRLGIVPTMPTAFYPPFLGARLGATLDHLTHGRVGLNLVTAHNDRAAQNFGLDRHHEHDLRYEMADEWIAVAKRLWASWDEGAVVADPETGVFTDPTKVHPIEFEGRFYRSRGPLNMPPGPQRGPVICQAGGSPAGRAFAAKHADTVIAKYRTIEAAQKYRADLSARMVACGRDPSACKALFGTSVVLADTMAEARERKRLMDAELEATMHARLAGMSYLSMIDFSKFDLDAPMPEIKTNASQTSALAYVADPTKTLRENLLDPGSGNIDFVGTPDSVAAEMGEAIATIGGDGFLFSDTLTRKKIIEVTDGLAPALKRRKLIKTGYQYATFRENLMEF
jgi:FMN-dependent oxidoreductase (nitrilotriacetate monooxygenase family)